jgi:LysM repeat protein
MKKVILSSLLSITLLSSGIVTASASPSLPSRYKATGTDTLWIISQKFNVKLSDLLAANPKVNPLNVYKGLAINLPSPASQKQGWESKADAIIATGMTQLGVPYVFGGNTPGAAFDCSGFIQYAFNKHGFNLLHSSALISQMGKPVDKSELRKGDLIFLQGTYKSGVSHIAIYLGNNKILHAGTMGTRNVKVSNLFGTPYYDSHYWGARRLIQ